MTQQTPVRTDDQGRVPRPPVQRISNQRVQAIKALAGAGAIALTIFDARVSYDGFRMLALPPFVPLVLALLILSIQLASGSVQQLGMNPFQGVGGSVAVDFVWRWVLVGVYILDIGSNAIVLGPSPCRWCCCCSVASSPLGMRFYCAWSTAWTLGPGLTAWPRLRAA